MKDPRDNPISIFYRALKSPKRLGEVSKITLLAKNKVSNKLGLLTLHTMPLTLHCNAGSLRSSLTGGQRNILFHDAGYFIDP